MAEQIAAYTAVTTAVSVVSSIMTFAEVGWRIITRVNEFVNDNGDVPKVLADVKALLLLLIEKMDQLKSLGEERLQKIEPQSALAEAVTDCRSHVNQLEILVNKLQPQVTDLWTKKVIHGLRRASQSMFYEGEISKVLIKLEAYKTKFILHFTDISADLDRVTTKEEAYYMVPFLQVSNYVERIDLLESVKSAVQQQREQQLRQVVVLLGMGGQGKSQLAMEYCRTTRLSKEFWAIFWIDASSIKSAHRSFERITSKIADPLRIFGSIEEKIAFVKDTVNGWDSRWLLVFDNYDAPNPNFNVAAFFPSSPFGTILVTSRHEDSKRLGKVIPLSKMTEQESLELLFHSSQNQLTDESMETGKSIVAKLEFLPLAINQAGAYISAQKLPLTLFLEHFDLQKEEILKYTPALTEYRRTLDDDGKETALNVFTTWELSFQQIQKDETGEKLRSFLTTAAFFNTRDIGEDLFHGANDLETVPLWIDAFISEGVWDSLKYRKVVAELSKLSLLNVAIQDTKQCRFYLHPLIADWLRLRVGRDIRRLCTIESCYLLAKLIENTDLQSCGHAFRLYLLEHVDDCLNNKRKYSTPLDEDGGFAKILTLHLGGLLWKTSRSREGISLVEEALSIIETEYGKDHGSTLDVVNDLGNWYSHERKLAEAEEMYKRALAGREKALGKDHASTLNTVDNLGILYCKQGKLVEAEEMHKRALVGREKTLGKDHASTLDTVNNLGLLYFNQGNLTQANEMYQRALAGREKAFGKDHASTLDTMDNLGVLYREQGKWVEAEEMHKRALVGREKAFGEDHASTLDIVNNLGILYRKQGKLVEAEEMHKRALARGEKAFGEDHAATLNIVDNLGILYGKQGKLVEAEEMHKRALARREKAFGKDYASTFDPASNLGILYCEQGKWVKAKEIYERALARREKVLGKDHASTLNIVDNLGILYYKQGKLVEAEKMHKRALVGREKAFGEDHALTLDTVNNLGILYHKQGKLVEAEEMHKRALVGREKALGKDHALTLLSVENLGILYYKQGKLVAAEEMQKHALAGKEKRFGKYYSSPLTSINNQDILYYKQGELQKQRSSLSTKAKVDCFEKETSLNSKKLSSNTEGGRALDPHTQDFKVNDNDSNFKRRAEEPGCDATEQLSELVEEFISETQNWNEGGFLVSAEWLHNLEEHEKEVLLSVLLRTGYSEVYQTTTTILYQRLDQDNVDTSNVIVWSDPPSPGLMTKPVEEGMRSSILNKDRETTTDSNLNTLQGKEKVTVSAEKMSKSIRSFIAALKEKGRLSYCVSTEWLFSLQNHEKEMLESICIETGYMETYRTGSTAYYGRIIEDHVSTCNDGSGGDANNDCSRPLESPSTSGGDIKGGDAHPKDMRSLSINDGIDGSPLISIATQPRQKCGDTECVPQLFKVNCTALHRSATGSSTSSQDVWGPSSTVPLSQRFVRELFGDNYVTLPFRYKSKEDYRTISTTVEKVIEMGGFEFRGKTELIVVPVNLKALAQTTVSCCLKNGPNCKKVRVKFPKIRGAIEYLDSKKPRVLDLVLESVYTNVDAFIDGDDESIPLNLEETDPNPHCRIVNSTDDQSGVFDPDWVQLAGKDPEGSEPGSITVELQCDARKRRQTLKNPVLRFQDPTRPVTLEGDIRPLPGLGSVLELDIRFGLRLAYTKPCQLPSGRPFCRTTEANQDIDFDCRFKYQARNLVLP